MSMSLRVADPAFGGAIVMDRSEWPLWRPSLVVSVLAHGALLLVVGWLVVEPVDRARDAPVDFVWIGRLVETATTAAESATAATVPQESLPAPPSSTPTPRAATPRRASVPALPPVSTSPVVPKESAARSPVLPSRLDLENARREAIAAVVDERARAGKFLTFSLDAAVPPQSEPVQHKPSIFDLKQFPGVGVLSPGRARTAFGFRARLWCNRITGGGFGFFGLPVCSSPGIQPPTGLFVESIPEYMKVKPDCVETRPLAALLGETPEFPTVKCRLVPKEPYE